jgi:hypothetical protein
VPSAGAPIAAAWAEAADVAAVLGIRMNGRPDCGSTKLRWP